MKVRINQVNKRDEEDKEIVEEDKTTREFKNMARSRRQSRNMEPKKKGSLTSNNV